MKAVMIAVTRRMKTIPAIATPIAVPTIVPDIDNVQQSLLYLICNW